MKKILMFMLILLGLVSTVNATLEAEWEFTNNGLDSSGNGHTLTVSGMSFQPNYPIYNISGNGSTYSADFDGISDRAFNDDIALKNIANDISISMWVRGDESQNDWATMIARGAFGENGYVTMSFLQDGTDYFRSEIEGSSCSASSDIQDGAWHNIVLVVNDVDDEINVYTDGVLEGNCSFIGTLSSHVTDGFELGNRDNDRYYGGKLDSIQIYDIVLTSQNVTNIFNYGGSPLVHQLSSNDSTESTAIVKQVGGVNINSPILSTVISSNYDVEINNTQLYGVYNFNVLSNANNDIYCELQIDGIHAVNSSRSNQVGVLGSMTLMSEHFPQEKGTHLQELLCSKVGGGIVTVSNVIGIGHILIDEYNNTINHNSSMFDISVSSGSNYTLLNQLNFTTSSLNLTNRTKYMVLEWSAEYNNIGISEVLNTYINVSGNVCSYYPRYVSTGNIGSVSGDCLLINVSDNQTYTIDFYGLGVNSNYVVNLMVKEFTLSEGEILGGAEALVGTNFTGNTDTKLITVFGGNVNHGLTNVFEKQSYSILTDEDTTVTMYIVLNNSVDLQTVDMTRDFVSGEIGVLTGQDIFMDIPQDDYNISVYANCGSVTATCQIVGGAGISYITDVKTTLLNFFNINVNDLWDNETILNFSAVDGVTFSTINGNLTYSTNDDFVNFTLISDYGNGYINKTFLNYNTSNNLSATLYQSIVELKAYDIYISTLVDNWTLQTIEGDFFTTNGTVVIYPKIDSYNWTYNSSTYFSKLSSFVVDEINESFSFIDVYDTDIDFFRFGSYQIFPDCDYLSLIDINETYNFALQSSDLIDLDCTLDGYNPLIVSLDEVDYSFPNNLSLNMSPVNLYVDVFDYISLNQITNFDVTIKNVSTQQVVYNATGLSVIDLNYSSNISGVMDIFVSKSGYQISNYRVDLTSQSSVINSIYLLNDSSLVILPITITNNLGTKYLSDVVATIYGYDQFNNKLLISQLTSDSSGAVYVSLIPGKIYSVTLSKEGYVKSMQDISSDEFSYIFRLTEESVGLFDYAGFTYDFSESFSNETVLTFSCYYFDEVSLINLVECYMTEAYDPSSEISALSLNSQTATLDFNINRPVSDTYYNLRIKVTRNGTILDKTNSVLVLGINNTLESPEYKIPQYTENDRSSEFLIVFSLTVVFYVGGFLLFGLLGSLIGGSFAWYIIYELVYINEYMFSLLIITHLGLLYLNRGGSF